MGDFGFNEGILILILIVMLIRPKDLPRFFYTLGKWYREGRRLYYSIYDELISIYELKSDSKPNQTPHQRAKPFSEQSD
jgi:Sec-independent protein translocase protein TatA